MFITLRRILVVGFSALAVPAAGQAAPQLPPANTPTNWICRGQVLDVNRRPVPGASVWAKGTQVAASTNSAGFFRLELPPGSYLLLVDYPGHLARDTRVSPTDSAFTILIHSTQTRATRR